MAKQIYFSSQHIKSKFGEGYKYPADLTFWRVVEESSDHDEQATRWELWASYGPEGTLVNTYEKAPTHEEADTDYEVWAKENVK